LSRALPLATALVLLGLAVLATAASATRTDRVYRTRVTTGTVITTYNGRWGRQLVVERHGQKLSLFEFSRDSPGKSACYGKCSRTWRPLIDRGKIVVRGRGIAKKYLTTFTRRDGSRQIAYFGQPLYRCYKNTKTGQDDGMNEYEFGGSWGLMAAQGGAVPPDAYGGRPPPKC
jgi:predicted lipoprotein with Yx(FWY)xxD motif